MVVGRNNTAVSSDVATTAYAYLYLTYWLFHRCNYC